MSVRFEVAYTAYQRRSWMERQPWYIRALIYCIYSAMIVGVLVLVGFGIFGLVQME